MTIRLYNIIIQKMRRMDLFVLCFAFSFALHMAGVISYYISGMPSQVSDNDKIYDAANLTFKDVDVDFIDLPPSVLMGGSTNPAPVQKEEWIEGRGKDKPDALDTDVNINKLSGDGTDQDGYMYADLSDHPPIPIIDFDINDYFPKEARSANITRKTVVVQVQVNEDGSIKGARVGSSPSGYGFDEAAMKLTEKLRFRPGKINGKPVKMLYPLKIIFELED